MAARREMPVHIESLATKETYADLSFRHTAVERRPSGPREIWINRDLIPEVPPARSPYPGTADGVVSGVSGVVLTPIVGNPRRFESTAGQFADMVPASLTAGLESYQPILRDADGKNIPYDPNVWVADGLLGVVDFPAGFPAGYKSPLTLDYWRYTGEFATGSSAVGTLASAGGAGTESLVVDGTIPDLSIKGLEAGAGIAIASGADRLTISSAVAALTSAGGVTTLVADGVGPDLSIYGLSAGSGIALSTTLDAGVTIDAAVSTHTVVDAWDPALANISGVSTIDGPTVGEYIQIGNSIHYSFKTTITPTAGLDVTLGFTLPVAMTAVRTAMIGSGFQGPAGAIKNDVRATFSSIDPALGEVAYIPASTASVDVYVSGTYIII